MISQGGRSLEHVHRYFHLRSDIRVIVRSYLHLRSDVLDDVTFARIKLHLRDNSDLGKDTQD